MATASNQSAICSIREFLEVCMYNGISLNVHYNIFLILFLIHIPLLGTTNRVMECLRLVRPRSLYSLSRRWSRQHGMHQLCFAIDLENICDVLTMDARSSLSQPRNQILEYISSTTSFQILNISLFRSTIAVEQQCKQNQHPLPFIYQTNIKQPDRDSCGR